MASVTVRERGRDGGRLVRIRRTLTARARTVAPYVIALDGLLVSTLGLISLIAAVEATRGESVAYFIAGLALIPLGLMMIVR
jgi:hypothetical protein